MINDEKITEYHFLIKSLPESHKNHDIENLCELVEYVRSEGILYQYFRKENVNLLENLLKISLDLIKDSLSYSSNRRWWFVMEVYDIVLHQVQLKEYPILCADLYFKLSKEVLDDKFHKYYKGDSRMHNYSMCIYFILMAKNWFATRKDEFLVLYKKIEPLIGDKPDHIEEPWINRYHELISNRN